VDVLEDYADAAETATSPDALKHATMGT